MDDGPRLTVKGVDEFKIRMLLNCFFLFNMSLFFLSTSTCLLSLSMLVRGFEIVGYGLGVGLLGHLN